MDVVLEVLAGSGVLAMGEQEEDRPVLPGAFAKTFIAKTFIAKTFIALPV